MTTANFLAADPFNILHMPRVLTIARAQMELMTAKQKKAIQPLLEAAKEADFQWTYGPSYLQDLAKYDANVARVNETGSALLAACGAEYT